MGNWRRACKSRVWIGTGKGCETKMYGGVAVAEMLGCNLSCGYCWVSDIKKIGHPSCQIERWNYQKPEDTYAWMKGLAIMNRLSKVRVSGCEPLLNKPHLLAVIKMAMEDGYKYVLDTNALLVDEAFLNALDPYRENIYLYVGLKGSTPELFEKITLADAKFWSRQLEGLRLIVQHDFTLGINMMANLTPPDSLLPLYETLHKICPVLPMTVDMKKCSYFAHNATRIKEYGLPTFSGAATQAIWNRIISVNYGEATALLPTFQAKETTTAFDKQEAKQLQESIIWDNGLKFVRRPLPFDVPVYNQPLFLGDIMGKIFTEADKIALKALRFYQDKGRYDKNEAEQLDRLIIALEARGEDC